VLCGKVLKKYATLPKVKFCRMGNNNKKIVVLQFSSVFCLVLGILIIESLQADV
jgi:hypothetical protein